MVDLSSLTFTELHKLYFMLGIEYLRRYWLVIMAVFVVLIITLTIAEKVGRR